MDNKKIAEGLANIAQSILDLSKQFGAVETIPEPVKEATPPVVETNAVDYTTLTFGNLKKYAEELGISTTGTKKELLARIDEALTESDSEELEDEDYEEIDFEAEVEEEEEDSEEEEESDDIEAQINAYSQEELADILTEAGLSAKGKKPALVKRVLEAIEAGDIEMYDEEADEEEEVSDEVQEESLDDGVLADPCDYSAMTDVRKEAVEAFRNETLLDVIEGSFPRTEQVEWLQGYHVDKDARKKMTDKEVLSDYLNCAILFIDDEGASYAEDLETIYEIDEEYYCCGVALEYDAKAKSFTCSRCKTEYEAE